MPRIPSPKPEPRGGLAGTGVPASPAGHAALGKPPTRPGPACPYDGGLCLAQTVRHTAEETLVTGNMQLPSRSHRVLTLSLAGCPSQARTLTSVEGTQVSRSSMSACCPLSIRRAPVRIHGDLTCPRPAATPPQNGSVVIPSSQVGKLRQAVVSDGPRETCSEPLADSTPGGLSPHGNWAPPSPGALS